MPYLDETGLAYYNEKLQPWISSQPVKTLPSSLYPWTLSEKASAVGIWPVGGTELKPTVDFLFTEVLPASGEKGPENPSIITGRDSISIVRAGENLYDPTKVVVSNNTSLDEDGFINFYRKNTGSSIVYASYYVPFVSLDPSKEWSLIGYLNDYSCIVNSTGKYDTAFGYHAWLNCAGNSSSSFGYWASVNFGKVSNDRYIYTRGFLISDLLKRDDWPEEGDPNYFFRTLGAVASGYTGSWKIKLAVCEKSSVYASTINLGNTYYGGTVDLASGVMTVTWHGLDLGTVSMRYSSTYDVFATSNIPSYINTGEQDCSCETFTYNSSALLSLPDGTFKYQGGNFNFKASQYNGDVSAFQSAHSGEVLVYKLATPYTVQLSPTQLLALPQPDKYVPRLNTVYTDAQAVQVGYVKSPIREEHELQQAIVAQGGNI